MVADELEKRLRAPRGRILIQRETPAEIQARRLKTLGLEGKMGLSLPEQFIDNDQHSGRYARVVDIGSGVESDLDVGMQVGVARHAGLSLAEGSQIISVTLDEIQVVVNEA